MAKIELTQHSEKIVEDQLASCRFADAVSVVDAALSLLQDRQTDRDEPLAEVRATVRASLDDPRPSIPAEEVFAELRAELKGMRR